MTGGEPQAVHAVEDRDADGVPVRIYRPSADPNLPIFVALHGGGWTIGSVEQYDGIARWLANASGAVVVSVDYRLAPEHPYPAPLDDCFTALKWAAAHASEIGGDASRIAIGGDSAGGNLAAVCALLARDAGGPQLALQALIYPVTDVDFGTASYVDNGEGYLLEAEQMRWFVESYTAGKVDPADWHVSPLRATDLAGVAPAVVLTAEYDPLRDEGELYAERLRDAGVDVEYECFEGMIHSFFGLPAFDKAHDAMDFVVTGLRRVFGTLGP
jgi:acetyl esterase